MIICVEETGTSIVSLTGDGIASNITAYESLGVKFDEGMTHFQSPTYPEQKIYIIFDPPHMLKLIRKHFSSNKIYHQNELVNWGLLEAIVGIDFNFYSVIRADPIRSNVSKSAASRSHTIMLSLL